MYDVIILGAGPAGLSAAVYAKRARLNALLIEKGGAGGQVLSTYEVDNYPGLPGVTGMELGQIFSQHADKFGIEKVTAEVIAIAAGEGKKIVKTNQGDYETAAVIIATGAKHARLGLEKENELTGMGVSYCATCDGMFFRKKEVAVVGGGNTAVQDALVLSEYCSRVYLIHRRSELRAEQSLAEQMLAKENIEFIGETVVEELQGEEMLESLTLRNLTTGAIQYLPVSALFEAIGQLPQNAVFSNLVELDGDGYFITDNNCATSCPGVFAAGDACRKSVRQLTTAVSDGTIAALSAVEYLR